MTREEAKKLAEEWAAKYASGLSGADYAVTYSNCLLSFLACFDAMTKPKSKPCPKCKAEMTFVPSTHWPVVSVWECKNKKCERLGMIPLLKITILKTNDELEKALLEVKDHGMDLRFYTQEKKRIDADSISTWELGWEDATIQRQSLSDGASNE